jgi:serine/threonine-protein kinase
LELKPGDRIDRFVLREQLGEGGQGAVWKAEDPLSPAKPRALKLVVVNPGRPNDVERVRREARALARLSHASLVACHGLFEELKLGVVGVVMDYVDGKSLRTAERDPRFGQKHRAAALTHVAHALAYLHENGIVHRDLKLDNVVVESAFFDAPDDANNVKVVDLGIAALKDAPQKLTALGTIVGTIAYPAPELLDPATFEADESAQAIDVFAFGVLGWQLMTGEHPTGLPGSAALVDYVRAYREAAERPVWPPGAPPGEWGALLVDALRVRQAERIKTGGDLARRCDAAPREPGGIVVRPGADPGERPEFAPTSVASPAAMQQPTVASPGVAAATAAIGPTPKAATLPSAPPAPASSKSAWLWALLGLVAVGGVGTWLVTSFTTKNTIAPIASASARAPAPSVSQAPETTIPDAAAEAEAGVEAGTDAAFTLPIGCNAESGECDCCPSGHGCEPGRCTDLLDTDEGWHLRLAEIPKNGEQDLASTHPSAEVCIKLSDVTQWTCTKVKELLDGGTSTSHLYATTLDLTQKGFDVDVRFPLRHDVSSTLARAERVKVPGAPRAVLCKGLEVKVEGQVLVDRVRFFVDDDDGAAPARKQCP